VYWSFSGKPTLTPSFALYCCNETAPRSLGSL
jgi:hypothetical protein